MYFPKKRFQNHLTNFALIGVITVSALASEASSILSCQLNQKQCIAKLTLARPGNQVKIMDGKARLAARGEIVGRTGAYGTIKIIESYQEISKGYPVIVELENEASPSHWTAMIPDSKQ
jgi:hypothetical protein